MSLKEISRISAIIKYRFSEVILIVALIIMTQVCTIQSQISDSESFSDKLPLLFFGIAAAVISLILSCGFLRSICYEPFHKHPPADLLSIGKPFFWRIVGYGLLMACFVMVLLLPVFLIAGQLFGTENSQPEVPTYFFSLAFMLIWLLLFKPSVFIPAFVLSRNTGVFESLRSLKTFNISRVKPVIILFIVHTLISFLPSFLSVSADKNIKVYYAVVVSFSVVGQVLRLMVLVGAVRFVISLDRQSENAGREEQQEQEDNERRSL